MEDDAWILTSEEKKFFDALDEKWTSKINEATLFPAKSKANRFIACNFNKKSVFPKKVKILR